MKGDIHLYMALLETALNTVQVSSIKVVSIVSADNKVRWAMVDRGVFSEARQVLLLRVVKFAHDGRAKEKKRFEGC